MENLFKKRQERIALFKKMQGKNKSTPIKKEIPENIFKSCDKCNYSIPYMELIENKYVCPRCFNHFTISANERIRQIIDVGSFEEFDSALKTVNKDKFIGYDEKLNKSMESTGLNEAVITGFGKINGYKCAIGVMDSRFMMGSMGSVVGEKITRLIEFSDRKGLPLIIFCASGGARMQEGIVSLMQMVKTSAALKKFDENGGLYISVITNPTTGGVSASFAMLGDIIIAEPDALIGFAGRRVIEKTINEVLPVEFQKSEFLMEKGFLDMIVERKNLKDILGSLLRIHGGNR